MKPYSLLAAFLIGCAPTPGKPPSTATTQGHIDSAKIAANSAQNHNNQARTYAERIDAKDRLIEEWHRAHDK